MFGNTNPFVPMLGSILSFGGTRWEFDDAHDTRCCFKDQGDPKRRITWSPSELCAMFERNSARWVVISMRVPV